MGDEAICHWCRQPGVPPMASVFAGEQGTRVAQLCEGCYRSAAGRQGLAAAFDAGRFGRAARLVWFHEVPDGGAQLLRVQRGDRRGLALFVADRPAGGEERERGMGGSARCWTR